MIKPGALVKSILPRGLLGRSLLILVTPLIVLQLVSAYVFFGTHWDLVTRRLALGLADDIASVIDMMDAFPRESMALNIDLIDGAELARTGMVGAAPRFQSAIMGYSLETNLTNALRGTV